ncbi:ribonuclease J [Candidatus Peregrinibacteria bacterium]|nr:MAG: ribonuclease J [Candidatus Peregrinibacteria bacterium]
MSKIDKLSEWLRTTVQGGSKAPLATPKGELLAGPASKARPQPKGPAKGPSVHPKVMRMIPVGGLEEVGKNCMIVEYEHDILVVDMGFQFPDDEMFGVDYIIPDIQYLVERKDRIRGILITHAHLDHIGGLPYVLPDLGFPPVYGSKLSLGLVQKQLEEHKLLKQTTLKVVDNEQVYHFGRFNVEFFRVNHSIPDAMGIFIQSPEGSIVHTGDFKFDFTPADGVECDMRKMNELGKRGVNILFADSTNATKPGHTISERVVAENLEKAISDAQGRIVVTCFASLIGRIQQIIDFAQMNGRKVFLSGGSLEANVEIAHKLGFIKFHKEQLQPLKEVNKFDDRQVLVLTTGGQGEPMAALSRMANGAHTQVKIHPGDTVVVSSSPIIGNEKSVAFLVDALARLGAHVVHNGIMDVHTSGHGQQEDLKLMMSLIRPDHLVPIHGNYYMRSAHGSLGPQVGIPAEHVHMMDNGNVIEIRAGKVEMKTEDIKVRFVVVDGEMRGDLGSHVLKEREMMAQNGMVSVVIKVNKGRVVGTPIVVTRGFFYQKEQLKFIRDLEHAAKNAVEKLGNREKRRLDIGDYEAAVRSELAGVILRRFDRRPLIHTVVLF